MNLITNESYSGSTICNTGYDGKNYENISFITRMKKINEQNIFEKPDIIFIFGGTNDSWADSPIGVSKHDYWTEDDLGKFMPATCYMFSQIKKWNPQATIINIINDDVKERIKDGFVETGEYYGIINIPLKAITKSGGHPDKNGMQQIYEQIKDFLLMQMETS